ncbi:hypothetical protein [Blastococcus saxobsidens]|uniref:Uncharacterized protein n=1 Tax=Blastococcus saxobsidens (strain DD2) TaxID=1146883 RepID=H6RJ00_BLASD|nr:hypothetical protein [Blastococcus saxobsidens]CCG03542.1 conserved exported protein of unknown function [Blastococcus saxobsidens DD2]
MVFWIVLAGVVVLALVVLGVVAYGVLGAFGRLDREVAAAERDVAPVLAQVQRASDRATQLRDGRSSGS